MHVKCFDLMSNNILQIYTNVTIHSSEFTVIVHTYMMYLEFNNMERGMKGTRIVTVEKKGLPFYWLWACALMHTDTSKDILCARRRHVLCVVLYMHGMQQTKSNVNIIHFKEINIIDKYVDFLVTY